MLSRGHQQGHSQGAHAAYSTFVTQPPTRVDPLDAAWPRHTSQATLRPITLDDVDAMWAYRRLPEVCAHLLHAPLAREEVITRIEGRLSGADPTPGRLVRGVAIVVDDRMVGDGMLRVQDSPGEAGGNHQLWIGYALHPSVAGRGIATEVACELASVGTELGLPVWADARVENLASRRVLEKAGFREVVRRVEGDDVLVVFTHP